MCESVEDVASAIDKYLETLTPEKCQRYINKLKEVKQFIKLNNIKIYKI